MLSLIMLFWIGSELHAPTWYWWFCGILTAKIIIKFAWDMYKTGRDS